MYKTRIKEKWWFSQCGRTWTPMTCIYGYSYFIHFKTVTTEVDIQFLSTLIMFPSLLPQFGSAFFSSKEGGVPLLCKSLLFGDEFLAQGLHLKSRNTRSVQLGLGLGFLQTVKFFHTDSIIISLWSLSYTQRHCHVKIEKSPVQTVAIN